VRDLVVEYLAFIDDVLDELGCRNEIEYIHTMLERGSGADRQLQVFRETGSLQAVVDYMAAETRADL
jgi:carboxylate-amine ligase